MADGVFTNAKGSVGEMTRDDATKFIVMLLKANEAETTLVDRLSITAMLAEGGTTEAVFTSYIRKEPLTATRTQDDSNERVDVDLPDQTWSPAGNVENDTLTRLIVCYENAAADTTRLPLTHHDFSAVTDGFDVTSQFNAAGFYRAA